jgi:TPR repeat protein
VVASQASPSLQVEEGTVPAHPLHRGGSKAVPLTDEGILALLEEYSDPVDPDLLRGKTGTGFDALRDQTEDVVQQVLDRGPQLIGSGFDGRRQWSNLGRLALAFEKNETAATFLRRASEAGSPSAQAYLSQLIEDPRERFALVNKAIAGGFKPALGMRKELENLAVQYLDKKLLHPAETERPSNVLGVPDDVLSNMSQEEMAYIFENFGDWVKTQTEHPRLAFGMGRAAWAFQDEARAKEYLELAAKLGSAGAPAYLARLGEFDDNPGKRLELLQESVNRGFAYAKPKLDEAKELAMHAQAKATAAIFDPSTFGAPKIIKMLYQGQVKELLSGSVSFDDMKVSQLPAELAAQFNRGLLLDYMHEFAVFVEGQEPGFLNALGVTIEANRSGTAQEATIKQSLSWSGVLLEKAGILEAAMVAVDDLSKGGFQRTAALLLTPDSGKKLMESRRQQIKDKGSNDARKLAVRIGVEGGNKEPFNKVYASIKEYIAKY